MPTKPNPTDVTLLRADDIVKTLVTRAGRPTGCKIALRPNGAGWRWFAVIYDRLHHTGRADNYDDALGAAEDWIREYALDHFTYE